LLRQKLESPDADSARHLNVIGSEIRRLDRVVQTLVDFTRPMELKLAEQDLRRLIDEVTSLASPDAEKHGVHIVRRLSETMLPVKVDADLIKQALLNIMINGMQAMPDGGDLTITTRHEGNEAIVEVSDEGSGIPRDIQDKIFNLYFTTKKGGSGIGLPMAYRVVQLHNGAMTFASAPGTGTTFRFSFPMVDLAADASGVLTSVDDSTVEEQAR